MLGGRMVLFGADMKNDFGRVCNIQTSIDPPHLRK